MFRRRVSGDVRRASFTGYGRNVYYSPPPFLQHRRQRRSRAVKGAREIDSEMTMPEFVGRCDDCGALRNTRVVDENVSIAKSFAHISKHARHAFRIGHIADQANRAGANLLRNFFNLFRRTRGDSNARALMCEGESDGASNAPATTGYQCE